ncbi:unnamed protein product [Symbiodinium necroappetens]|uniref:Uncharacterized protein n=1 Tax=Symbiodinium necroappetens TaxID=1628268 RepID=A0A812Q4T4_9DINO|nr:unnamed protein product [Symbiodinium necroappetens]
MLACRRLSASFLLLAPVTCVPGMLYAKEIIERYDHKGGARVTKEIFAEDLNMMKNLAENGFQVNETCSHDLCVAPVPLASRRAETDKWKQQVEEEVQRLEKETAQANAERAEAEQRRADAERLRAEAQKRQREEEARRRAAEEEERRSRFRFRSSGDPMLCAYSSSGEVVEKSCVNYTGPAVVTCYDNQGIQRIIWVGVSDEDGSNKQGEDAWWVAETVALNVANGTWSYEDVTGKHVADVSCDTAEGGTAMVTESPPMDFLKTFQKSSKTFLVHTMQPRIIPGPKYSFMEDMLSRDKLADLVYDEQNAREWLNAFLMMLGYATEHNVHSKALGEIAKYAVIYGVSQAKKAQAASKRQHAWLSTGVSV